MGYHKRQIKRGVYGEISKLQEEVEEYLDAKDQGIEIMQTIELSDMYGALEALAEKHHLDMNDLKAMSDATKSAFIEGDRK